MKNLLLVSFLIIGGIVNAQWVQKHSDVYQLYNSVFFVDSSYGFVAGYQYPDPAFILKTTDGGENWTQSNIDGSPSSLSFVSYDLGYCAAFNGIYKTTDGGDNWNLNYQDNVHYCSVQFIDDTLGFAVGNEYPQNLYLAKTIDGGLNWNKTLVALEEGNPIINMVNASVGFIVSENSTKIYKTIDGGGNWNIVFSDSIFSHPIWDISFSDELNGVAGYIGGKILSTSDGGNTWHKKFIPLTFISNIQTIANHCWVSGFGVGYNAIVYSDDFGDTWTPIFEEDSLDFEDIFFSDLNNGWLCSHSFVSAPIYNGSIYKIETDWLSQITVPTTPQQIYPSNNSNIEEIVIDFEWEKLNYSLTRFQVSTDSMFNSFYFLLYSGNGDTTFFGNNLYIENIKSVAFPYDQKYYWRVRSENLNGVSEWSETWSFTTSSPTSVDEKIIPDQISLEQNYPNPFNPSTKISWQSSVTSHQTIKVYDVLGNEVATLVDEFRNAGSYEINFNANSLSSGIYFYKLTIGSFVDSKKMILLR